MSALIQDHYLNRRNFKPVDNPTHVGQSGEEGGGPFMKLLFHAERDLILDASYKTYGCPLAIGCASFISEFSKGKKIGQLLLLDVNDLNRIVGGVPPGKEYCLKLVIDTLSDAFKCSG